MKNLSVVWLLAALFSSNLSLFADSPVLTLNGRTHNGSISGLFVLPDGSLSSISHDKSLRTWSNDFSSCVVRRLESRPGKVGALTKCAVSANGDLLALSTMFSPGGVAEPKAKPSIYLIKLPDFTILRNWQAHDFDVTHLEFSPSGKYLLSTSEDKTTKLWDVDQGSLYLSLVGHSSPVTCGAFSSSGNRVATVGSDKVCNVWTIEGTKISSFVAHSDIVTSVVWENELLITGSLDRSVKIWESSGKLVSATTIPSVVRKIFPSPNPGQYFCSAGGYHNNVDEKDSILIFNSRTKSVSSWFASTDRVNAVVFQDRVLFSGDSVGRIHKLDMKTGNTISKLEPQNLPIYRVGLDGKSGFLQFGTTWAFRPDQIPINKTIRSLSDSISDVSPTYARRDIRRFGGSEIGITADQRVGVKSPAGTKVLHIPREDYNTTIRIVALISEREALVGTDKGLFVYDAVTGAKTTSLNGHANGITDISFSADRKYFVTASIDQTVIFWRTRTKASFLTFFASGDDWVMWNASGQYASSPDGERLIAWQVNRGPNEFGDVLPAIRFRDHLYRPEVIKEALADPDFSANNNLLKPGKDALSLLPPDVKIISPKNGEVSETGTVVIEAIAKPRGSNPVSWVELRHNGCTARDLRGGNRRFGSEGNELKTSWEVKLEPGVDNAFSVVAFSKASGTESVSLPVRLKVAQELSGGNAVFRNLYIISVGISQYKDQKKLAFAKQDAERISKKIELRAKGLFEKIQTKVLLEENVSDKSIQEAFLEIRQAQSVKDLAIVFFAGHGTSDKDGDYNFLYHDCPKDKARLQQYGFSVTEFEKEIKDLCPVVLLLDTCSAGELTSDASRIFAKKANVMTFVSSDRQEAALENSSIGMSNFAYAICQALDGRAELRPLGKQKALFAQPFVKFVRNEVEVQSKESQHPRMVWGEFQGQDFAMSLFDNSSK